MSHGLLEESSPIRQARVSRNASMNFSPNYLAWTPSPAVNRTLRIKPRKAGYLERSMEAK